MPTAIIAIRIPLRSIPRPQTVEVQAGRYRREGAVLLRDEPPPMVDVAEQTGRVVGWWDSHSNMQTVLNVEVQTHAQQS